MWLERKELYIELYMKNMVLKRRVGEIWWHYGS